MYCNRYIKELDIEVDYNALKDLALKAKRVPSGHMNQRLVADNPFLSRLREQFPFFSPVYNVYRFPENSGIPVHIDAERDCALNIPLSNTENSHTIFYDVYEPLVTVYDPTKIAHMVKSQVTECFRFTLSRPTLINNGDRRWPHSVTHTGPGERIILSWSTLKGLSFMQVCDLFTDDVVKKLNFKDIV